MTTQRSAQNSLHFKQALLPDGWQRDVRLTLQNGRFASVHTGMTPDRYDERHAIGLPGMPNLHSHAFQRGMAGLAEARGAANDSFWTWRETMYRFVDRINPDQLRAIAALAYIEMLESGFTRVGEFHYLHHDKNGGHFDDPAEMSAAIITAAGDSGIGLTLLPVFYAHSGFGGLAPNHSQRRFTNSLDGFAKLLEATRSKITSLADGIVGIAPHSLRAVSLDALRELETLAETSPIHIHIAEQTREVEECLAWSGARPVAWLLDHAPVDAHWCLVHATHMTNEETVRFAQSGAVAGLCPITEANLGDGIFPAGTFLEAGGWFGIGSDSNVRIDMTEELRLLEYGQRLNVRSRNVLARGPAQSTGHSIFQAAVDGGAQALGSPSGLVAGNSADVVSLNPGHMSLLHRDGNALLDSLLFSAGQGAIDCVWRCGDKLVSAGRHIARDRIETEYQAVLGEILHEDTAA